METNCTYTPVTVPGRITTYNPVAVVQVKIRPESCLPVGFPTDLPDFVCFTRGISERVPTGDGTLSFYTC